MPTFGPGFPNSDNPYRVERYLLGRNVSALCSTVKPILEFGSDPFVCFRFAFKVSYNL
jgi:hypothetical protein